jgi:PEP-CTERM motif
MSTAIRNTILLACALLAVPTTARADTIVDVWNSVIGTGTLGTQSFTNSLVTISSVVDLTQVLYDCSFPVSGIGCESTNPSPNQYTVAPNVLGIEDYTVNVAVAGLGTYQGWSSYDVLFTYDPVSNFFQAGNICDLAYDLCLGDPSEIGDNCNLPFNECPVSTATSGGYLILTSEEYNTFQTGGGVTSSTPEPNTLLLIATGMLGCITLARRRISPTQP